MTLAGLLAPENLLDIVRNFVVFEHDIGCGKVIKKFRAISSSPRSTKPSLAPGTGTAGDRGGVVWTTQGSSKSLTMLWLALKLRRDPRHGNRRC